MRIRKKGEVTVVRLDTDSQEDIRKFQEQWNKLKVDVAFVPKVVKFEGDKK